MRICTVLLATAALAASEVPVFREDGGVRLVTVWIEGGMAPGITGGDVADVSSAGLSGTFDQELDGSWRPGGHAGIELSWGSVDLDGDGWVMGTALWYDRMPGRITAATSSGGSTAVDADLEITTISLALAPAFAYRFDADALLRVAPRSWQVEVGPVAAIGFGQAVLDGGDPSDWGLAWQAGARVRMHGALTRHLRLGLYAGALYVQSQNEWQNTGRSTFTGGGPIAGAMLGWEF